MFTPQILATREHAEDATSGVDHAIAATLTRAGLGLVRRSGDALTRPDVGPHATIRGARTGGHKGNAFPGGAHHAIAATLVRPGVASGGHAAVWLRGSRVLAG